MLGAALFSSMKSQYNFTIDTLGTPMQWVHVKSGLTKTVNAGMKIAGDNDAALVQAYGVGARIITVKAIDFSTDKPEKFDKFVSGAETYIAEAVHPVHLNAEVIGYRVYIKGR